MKGNSSLRRGRLFLSGPVIALVSLLLLLWAASCNRSPVSAPPMTPSAMPVAVAPVTATLTPATIGAGQPPISGTVEPLSGTIVLNWWTPEQISPRAQQPSGPLLDKYLAAFEAAHPDKVQVNATLKAKYGKGGLLDLLRTAQPVAPGILPDLITLDMSELEEAASLGLLQPLDSLIDPATIANLYPFARQAGQFDGQTLAIPFVADLDHAIYNRSQVSTAPSTWAELISAQVHYLFPAGNPQPASATGLAEDVQPAFISQYLSAGGSFKTDTRQLVIQPEALTACFRSTATHARRGSCRPMPWISPGLKTIGLSMPRAR